MYLGDRHFWLRSGYGLAIILGASIFPTFTIALWLGNTSDMMALIVGVAISAARQAAWMRWGDEDG